jgi:hypothetical protein
MRPGTLLLIAIATLGGLITGAAPESGAAPPPSRLLVFEDADGLRLAIQAEPRAADAGMFTLRVPGRGTYLATAPATLAVESPQSTNVTFEGSVDLVTQQGTSVRLGARLQAHLDAPHHMAEATLTTATDRFHLVVHAAARTGLESVLRTFEAATTAGDWAAIYGIASSDYTKSYGLDAFLATARSQSTTVGTVSSVRRLQTGDVQSSPLGFSYLVVTYEVRRSVGGVARATTDNVYFISEGGTWRLWFSIAQ